MVAPWIIGGGLALAGGLINQFSRGSSKPKKMKTMNPMQEDMFNQYGQAAMGNGGPMGDMFDWNPDQSKDVFNQMYAQPAYQQFQEEIIPGITGQFRGGNMQNSSYMAGALSKAGTNVQNNLNAQLANMLYQGQQDSINRRMNAINNILGTQTMAYSQPQQTSANAFGNSMMNIGGNMFGKWAGGQ